MGLKVDYQWKILLQVYYVVYNNLAEGISAEPYFENDLGFISITDKVETITHNRGIAREYLTFGNIAVVSARVIMRLKAKRPEWFKEASPS